MHVGFLCNEYPPGRHGGVGSFTQTLARRLAARNHRVTVVGYYRRRTDTEETDRGVRVVRLANAAIPRTGFLLNGLRLRQTLTRLHRADPFDVIEGPELSLAVVPKAFPAAKVIRMHGGHRFFATTLGARPRAWRSWLETRSFDRADHLCAVSRFVAETTRELLHLGGRRVDVIPNPIDLSMFAPQSDQHEREQPGLVLFVGTVCAKKGVRELVLAMDRVVSHVPNARLMVVGRDSQEAGGSYVRFLRTQVPPHLQTRIEFTGPVERTELPAIIGRAQVCAYPSHMEALPVAWLEGMAMGKACAASVLGPGPEVFEHRVSGLLCDPRDPNAIAADLIELLTDPVLRRRLGAAARARAAEHFAEAGLVRKNEAFYERCVEESARARA